MTDYETKRAAIAEAQGWDLCSKPRFRTAYDIDTGQPLGAWCDIHGIDPDGVERPLPNPLANDGDAMAVLRHFRLSVDFHMDYVCVEGGLRHPVSGLRAAIVDAAYAFVTRASTS